MSNEYCQNCKYGVDGNGCLPFCRRDLKTEIHLNTKACTYFIKARIKPADSDLKRAIGVYHNNFELAEEIQKISPIYYDESRNFWLWKKIERYWKRIDETDILNATRNESGEYVIDNTTRKELITAIQMTGRLRDVQPIHKNWISAADGVFDILTKEQIRATPAYFFTAPIPHKIGVDEDTPTIDKLFKDWMGDNATILYEICAYCLLDDYPIHRMFLLFGRGRNGKSQFLKLLTRFVGQINTVSTSLEVLIESRFEAAKLYKKKIALIGETDFNVIKSTDKLKRLTGDDMIAGEYKHKDPFDFFNTAKIIIATNSLPETLDKTEAFYARAVILEFLNQFDEGISVVESVPEKEYENLLLKCIKILPDLLERGKFTNEGSIDDKAKRYEKLSNPFETFKNNALVDSCDAITPMWKIQDLYEIFCKKNGFRVVSKKELTQIIKKDGYEVKQKRFGDKNWQAVFGLTTAEPYILSDDVEDVEHVEGSSFNPLYGKLNETSSTSSTCSTNIQEAVEFLKESFDQKYHDTNGELPKITEIMVNALQVRFEELDLSPDIAVKIVHDYQRARRMRS